MRAASMRGRVTHLPEEGDRATKPHHAPPLSPSKKHVPRSQAEHTELSAGHGPASPGAPPAPHTGI